MNTKISNPLGIEYKNSVDYIETVFSCLHNGRVAVPLNGSQDHYRIQAANIKEIVSPKGGGGWVLAHHTPSTDNNIAHVSFTSGTEGKPKGVLLSHNNLGSVVKRLNSAMAIDDSIREYIGIPVYHSFGYGRCRAVSAVGGQFFIPEHGFNPIEIANMLKKGEINAISAVPTLWRLLIENSDIIGSHGNAIKWIEIGSQYMSTREKLILRSIFPNAVIIQHYGLTEASRSTLLRVHEEPEDRLESVGKPSEDAAVRINDQGCVEIQGHHVAESIIRNGSIEPLINDEGWFTTSDLGELDDGYLYYKGRADDIINCGGIKLSPEAIESELCAQYGPLPEMAISRTSDPTRGDGVLVSVTEKIEVPSAELISSVKTIINKMGVNAGNAIFFQQVEIIPKTGPGKVQRRKLTEIYTDRQESSQATGNGVQCTTFKQYLEMQLGIENIEHSASFKSLGGDSLSYISLEMFLQKHLSSLPEDWTQITVAELENLLSVDSPDYSSSSEDLCAKRQPTPPLPNGKSNCNPSDIGFFQLIREDFNTHERDFFSQGFWAVFVNRFGNWRMSIKNKLIRAPLTLIYRVMAKWIQITCGIKLDYTVKLGRRVKLEHFGGMILGARSIGDDVIIRQNSTFGIRSVDDLNAKPIIENNVDIGAGAVITGHIRIGQNSTIGANSVVFTDIPKNSIVMGVPAKIISTKSIN